MNLARILSLVSMASLLIVAGICDHEALAQSSKVDPSELTSKIQRLVDLAAHHELDTLRVKLDQGSQQWDTGLSLFEPPVYPGMFCSMPQDKEDDDAQITCPFGAKPEEADGQIALLMRAVESLDGVTTIGKQKIPLPAPQWRNNSHTLSIEYWRKVDSSWKNATKIEILIADEKLDHDREDVSIFFSIY